jgi:hypothetical protein
MNTINGILDRSARNDLRRIVEPLASYICATDEPRKALATAVAALLTEVAATNEAAVSHFHRYSNN